MLFTIAVILLVLWLLGMVSSYTIGGFIHILLGVAIAALLRVIQGPEPAQDNRSKPAISRADRSRARS